MTIRHYTMRELAARDNQAMAIWAEFASGHGANDWHAWFAAHEIDDLPAEVAAAIAAGDVVDYAQADYGGGVEATNWYELRDGRVYAVPTSANPSFWAADDESAVPAITDYDPCGGRYSDCTEGGDA